MALNSVKPLKTSKAAKKKTCQRRSVPALLFGELLVCVSQCVSLRDHHRLTLFIPSATRVSTLSAAPPPTSTAKTDDAGISRKRGPESRAPSVGLRGWQWRASGKQLASFHQLRMSLELALVHHIGGRPTLLSGASPSFSPHALAAPRCSSQVAACWAHARSIYTQRWSKAVISSLFRNSAGEYIGRVL